MRLKIAELLNCRSSEVLFGVNSSELFNIFSNGMDFGSGYRHDLEKLGAFCRRRGIWFTVDATQSCGAMNIDVAKMKMDFLTTSTYKWLQCLLGLGSKGIQAMPESEGEVPSLVRSSTIKNTAVA